MKNIELGSIRGWENCYIELSLYENNTLCAVLLSEEGKKLLQLSQMGPDNPSGLIMCVPAATRKQQITTEIMSKLMSLNIVYGYILKDGCAICAVNDRIVGNA